MVAASAIGGNLRDDEMQDLEPEFSGRTAVITGGAQGLGLAIAGMLTEHGARVALIDVDEEALATAIQYLKSKGGDPASVRGDIRRRAGARQAFSDALTALGRVDILINNAGVYPRKNILDIDDDTWDLVFDVNLRGMYNMTAAAVEHMKPSRYGRVVSISSIDGFLPYPKNAHYAAAKAGVISLNKSFADAFAPDQILINTVAPAAIATEKLRILGILDDLKEASPLGRVATPEDIAEVVCFLASDRNRYITGETVIASGGVLMV